MKNPYSITNLFLTCVDSIGVVQGMDDLIFKNFELIKVEDASGVERKHIECLLSNQISEEKENILKKTLECYQASLETAVYCLTSRKDQEYIDLLFYFAEVCQISAELLVTYPEVYELTRDVSLKTGKLCIQQTEKMKEQIPINRSNNHAIFDRLINKCTDLHSSLSLSITYDFAS